MSAGLGTHVIGDFEGTAHLVNQLGLPQTSCHSEIRCDAWVLLSLFAGLIKNLKSSLYQGGISAAFDR
jgi:hypothetical protein